MTTTTTQGDTMNTQTTAHQLAERAAHLVGNLGGDIKVKGRTDPVLIGFAEAAYIALDAQTPFAIEIAIFDANRVAGPYPPLSTNSAERQAWVGTFVAAFLDGVAR